MHTYRGGPNCESAETVHTRTHKAVFDRRRHIMRGAVTQKEGAGADNGQTYRQTGMGTEERLYTKRLIPV